LIPIIIGVPVKNASSPFTFLEMSTSAGLSTRLFFGRKRRSRITGKSETVPGIGIRRVFTHTHTRHRRTVNIKTVVSRYDFDGVHAQIYIYIHKAMVRITIKTGSAAVGVTGSAGAAWS